MKIAPRGRNRRQRLKSQRWLHNFPPERWRLRQIAIAIQYCALVGTPARESKWFKGSFKRMFRSPLRSRSLFVCASQKVGSRIVRPKARGVDFRDAHWNPLKPIDIIVVPLWLTKKEITGYLSAESFDDRFEIRPLKTKRKRKIGRRMRIRSRNLTCHYLSFHRKCETNQSSSNPLEKKVVNISRTSRG